MDFIRELWSMVLVKLSESYNELTMKLWFNDLMLTHLDDNSAYISIDSEFKKDIIEKKYGDVLKKCIDECLGFPVNVSVYVRKSEDELDGDDTDQADQSDNIAQSHPNFYSDDYTFDTFVIGSSNKIAHAACTAVANFPAAAYNPLFIYGPSGLGKTHLLYAVINEIKKKHPDMKVLYVKGEEFTNQLIDSIAVKKPVIFREKYRNADVLLVDDVQFIAGRISTQEEFFHTFNALYEQKKQIVLTSDRPPKDIQSLDDRLRSRFNSGLVTDIAPPDFELRAAILKKKATLLGIELPSDVLQFLTENIKDNIRQLEGAIKKLSAHSFIKNEPISLELAKTTLSDLLSNSEPTSVTIEKIFSTVCKQYSVTRDDIKSRKRNADILKARNISIYLIRTLTDMSLPAIGRLFDRDHTTVMNSLTNIENQKKSDILFLNEINDIIQDLKN
ncbi:MAG TPA: chromosomal replication initiator protein DnaA [Bacillota bacterium]|nr:chromosomal replication initiator protein DnaA [Bacillota bacterium]